MLADHPEARLAWLDPADAWDPDSARRAGVRLDQLLWVRGESGADHGLPALSLWHRALGVVVAAGGFDLVVADFAAWPLGELRRTPRSAWFRLLRGLERTRQTALVVLAPAPLAGTAAALVVEVHRAGARFAPGWARLEAVEIEGRLLRGPGAASQSTASRLPPLELPA